jgi:hypothetical protein
VNGTLPSVTPLRHAATSGPRRATQLTVREGEYSERQFPVTLASPDFIRPPSASATCIDDSPSCDNHLGRLETICVGDRVWLAPMRLWSGRSRVAATFCYGAVTSDAGALFLDAAKDLAVRWTCRLNAAETMRGAQG